MKHLFVHLVRQFPAKEQVRLDPAKEVTEHIREVLSAEHLTSVLKTRLVEKRKREALREELMHLEHDLLHIEDQRGDKIELLRARIDEMKKKL